jgi:hypothetical protein
MTSDRPQEGSFVQRLVPQAEPGDEGGLSRERKLGAQRRERVAVTWLGAPFRAAGVFHTGDQHRKPGFLATLYLQRLNPLAHLLESLSAARLTNPAAGKTFRQYQRKENAGYVTCFTGRFRTRA